MAQKMANAFVSDNVRKVAVFDFAGPDGKLTALGQDLAGEFSRSLQHESGSISVIDRADVQAVVQANRLVPGVVRNTEVVSWLASQLEVDAFVVGSLIPVHNQLSVGVTSIRVKSSKVVAEFTDSIPFSDKINALLAVVITPAPRLDGFQEPPANGTAAKCIHCPSPSYSRPGVQDRIEGTVVLSALVGLDGRARDIDIVKPLSDGLVEQAIAALKSWTFVPAKSADGKPLELKTLFEMTFRLKS